MKKKSARLINTLIAAIVLLLIICCGYLFGIFAQYKRSRDLYQSEKDSIIKDSGNASDRYVDFDFLREESTGACAWIYIPETNIDYPLVQDSDNSFYLNHDAYGNDSSSGAIFLSCYNDISLSDKKNIIYGHNMKDGSMFHDLRYYVEEDFGKEHPYLYIYMSDQTIRKYEVHSTALINSSDELVYIPVINESVEYVLDYVDKMSDMVYNDYTGNDILILSTCQRGENRRVVVFQEVS